MSVRNQGRAGNAASPRSGAGSEGRILEPRVGGWPGSPGESVRRDCEEAIAQQLGRPAAEAVRPWLDDLPLGRLGRVWSRLPYVRDAEDLNDPEWSLEAAPLSVVDLALRAFEGTGKAGLLLELLTRRLGPPEPLALLTAIPWLQHMRDARRFADALRSTGWAVLECRSPHEACRLGAAVDSSRVRARRLGLNRTFPPSLLGDEPKQ